MQLIQLYEDFLFEAESTDSFEDFAQKRHDGASKIVDAAKSKGGIAMLTYHHFVVKLPYYKKAAAGKFKTDAAKQEVKGLQAELDSILAKFDHGSQVRFQKVMGKIEVLGELLIRLDH
jgi:hypothetical protein